MQQVSGLESFIYIACFHFDYVVNNSFGGIRLSPCFEATKQSAGLLFQQLDPTSERGFVCRNVDIEWILWNLEAGIWFGGFQESIFWAIFYSITYLEFLIGKNKNLRTFMSQFNENHKRKTISVVRAIFIGEDNFYVSGKDLTSLSLTNHEMWTK